MAKPNIGQPIRPNERDLRQVRRSLQKISQGGGESGSAGTPGRDATLTDGVLRWFVQKDMKGPLDFTDRDLLFRVNPGWGFVMLTCQGYRVDGTSGDATGEWWVEADEDTPGIGVTPLVSLHTIGGTPCAYPQSSGADINFYHWDHPTGYGSLTVDTDTFTNGKCYPLVPFKVNPASNVPMDVVLKAKYISTWTSGGVTFPATQFFVWGTYILIKPPPAIDAEQPGFDSGISPWDWSPSNNACPAYPAL